MSAIRLGCVLALAFLHAGCGPRDAARTSAVDLAGRAVDPLLGRGAKAVVCLFLSTDCPISNRYAPELQRLHAQFSQQGVTFWLVYPNADETPPVVQKHTNDFRLPIPPLRDPFHVFVARAGVRVTPEAAVFEGGGRLVYHGRIDNRHVALGEERPAATQHDLEETIQALLDGKPPPAAVTTAVGCSIPKQR